MRDTVGDEGRVLVLNPVSGSEDHEPEVTARAHDRGFEIRRTEQAGDATRFAREAAEAGADLVAAAGGDGTINEVVNGIVDADALEETDLAVVPTGTGNNFAANVGIEGIGHAFRLIDDGERRDIDLGRANERAFANSCVGGITAEASTSTSSDGKREFGVLAYVLSTIEAMAEFDPLPLRVETAVEGGESTWEGEAVFVLVGNCRRFTGARTAQAHVEDGLFEVTVVEQANTVDLVGEAALDRLFGRDETHIVRRRTPSLTVETLDERPVKYSLDGEVLETNALELETIPAALTVVVGEAYAPNPDERGG